MSQVVSVSNYPSEGIKNLKEKIEPFKKVLSGHPLYHAIKDLQSLKVFMESHVYAVWDFMSLLKALQNNFSCTTVPWYPTMKGSMTYLINEIVVGEESDIDMNGNRKSHFEIYLDGMLQLGADRTKILKFIDVLKSTSNLNTATRISSVPIAAKEFMTLTFEFINSNKLHVLAAVFTFGREDLIPEIFTSMINQLNIDFPNQISIFKYYLERHIEVDGDYHSKLAIKMTEDLCKDQAHLWREAEDAVIKALISRIKLWDSIYNSLKEKYN